MGVDLPCAGTVVCIVWPGAGMARSQGLPPDFYLPHVNVRLSMPPPPLYPVSATPPILPVWMKVASLNP